MEDHVGGGRQVGDYVLVRPIGSGASSQVWLGRHRKRGTEVAVKEIAMERIGSKLRDSLLSEVDILRRIRHPNIIDLHDSIRDGGKLYLILEYCRGGDLHSYLLRHKRVSETVAKHFIRQLASGLQMLRDSNVVHRDLKPQNILLVANNENSLLKIADFGFAKFLPSSCLAETLCGSPLYMAPEVMQAQKYDAKADLWSVGIILYQLVTGFPPFNGDSQIQLLKNILKTSELRFPSHCELSHGCTDLCRKLLRINSVDRLTVDEFVNHPFLSEHAPERTLSRTPSDIRDGLPFINSSPMRPSSQSSQEDCMPFPLDDESTGQDESHVPENKSAMKSYGFAMSKKLDKTSAAVCRGVVIVPMARKQHVVIFTTASLPWMTGTAVNPLFRAAYLAEAGDWEVTLVVPWLSNGDQVLVYPNKMKFGAPTEQESYVRRWLEERIGMLPRFDIKFYPGKFAKEKRSILPVGDITQTISDDRADIAVLEEPEHLTWYHHGRRWKNKFQKVIGVVHTNYLEYVKREKNGYFHAFFLKHINSWVTDIYCHKVIRLSAATQDVPRSVICNVHGVNPKFIEIGKLKHQQISQREQAFFKGAYYIGKMVWSKGYTELLQLLQKQQKELSGLKMELYGSGEDADEVKASAEKLNLDVSVYPGRDHGDSIFHDYKVFINPSTTDVVCTTTAEALAMGKIVICANHPSNEFFKRFPNCHMYNTEREFVRLTMKAMAEEPIPLSEELRHELSWEAATERFVRVADISPAMPIKQHPSSSQHFMHISPDELKKNMEDASAFFHNAISGIEVARCVFGAIPNTLQPDEQQCKELGWRLQG